MTEEKRSRFTVISNTDLDLSSTVKEKLNTEANRHVTPPQTGYSTNPMYEKLLEFQEKQKRKRFTVEDLLKW